MDQVLYELLSSTLKLFEYIPAILELLGMLFIALIWMGRKEIFNKKAGPTQQSMLGHPRASECPTPADELS